MNDITHVRWFEDLSSDDVPSVGGKNASLGEMLRQLKSQDIRVPDGFATTADAYRKFLAHNDLEDQIRSLIDEFHEGSKSIQEVGKSIRRLFTRNAEFPEDTAEAIRDAYHQLSERYETDEVDIAARSSATAEDLPEASFAGQQETFLNITGEVDLLDACKRCYASLFTDRAISYREEHGFDHMKVALSVGVQKMVRADKAGSGVMFTIDTETGFPDVVVINAAWGLGENVVQGAVNPDEYRVFKALLDDEKLKPIIEKTLGTKEKKMVYATGGSKSTKNEDTAQSKRQTFVLNDEQILRLARWAKNIEDLYERPMDIEWALDGELDELFIVQARPETVQSQKDASSLKTYHIKERRERLLTGIAIGSAVAAGEAQIIKSADEIDRFKEGSILITGMTDPDWVPIMKQAAGIVTDYGGRTSHAAIVSRELGIPAVVGTGNATRKLDDGQEITLSSVEGEDGYIYEGTLEFETEEIDLTDVPETNTQIMMNIASPAAAFRWWRLPVEGIGLARMEFIINNVIKIHPLALVHFDELEDQQVKDEIAEITHGYEDKTDYFVDHLSRGIAMIAAAQYPHRVIVRMSDFKTNEYADLIGGSGFEPEEANPMLGFRGASRYYSDEYRPGFALECKAIKRVREEIGLTNVVMMIPFCRTPAEADRVIGVLDENGLRRGENGLKVYVMAEIPANVVLTKEFAQRFDGFSIGTNDLTQLTLGVDRDSQKLSELFDERNDAIKRTIENLIEAAHEADTPVGICGEAPSNYPEFAAFLVEAGIDSISVSPDSVIKVIDHVYEQEQDTKAVAD
ncbi:MAG: phosphoenolpyruvate synthase [Chloroflexota bacterium]